jgi:hypothetical protein
VKKLLGQNLHPGMDIRFRALDVLASSKNVEARLVIRNGFWAGLQQPGVIQNPDEVRKVRREFVDSIAGSDYVLCARGAGNFSYRLYETLSLGRIPLFIDTDCVLPYEREIDWKSLSVCVDASDMDYLDQAVADFHSRISPEDFQKLQQRCRAVWEEWIRPVGFFSNLAGIIRR